MARNSDPSDSCAACSPGSAPIRINPDANAPAAARKPDPALLRAGAFLGAAVLTAGAAFLLEIGLPGFPPNPRLSLALFAAAYLLSGWKVLAGAARNILRGKPFDELFLMSLSTLGAFLIAHPEEAVGVMVFYRIGELFQESAVLRSRRSIRAVLALRPDSARVRRDGIETILAPESVGVGELVLVRPGERVPLDGIVEAGEAYLDESALTGESVPRRAYAGIETRAGSIVHEGVLTIRVSRPASGSYAARIAELVENASKAKSRSERFITRFARWYTPAVVAAAAALALLPPLLVPGQELSVWIYRSLVMLVISCPCALVLSVPLGYFAGLGGAARRGILVKGSLAFDVLAEARTVVFDKTGTLTTGEFEVKTVRPAEGRTAKEVLLLAAGAESDSNHPIAAALRREAGRIRGLTGEPAFSAGTALSSGSASGERSRSREIPGSGMIVETGRGRVAVGTAVLLADEGIEIPSSALEAGSGGQTEVYVAENGAFAGKISLGDSIRPDAAETLDQLRDQGVRRFVLLTGDAREPAHAVAAELGIPEVHFGLLPHEKLERLEIVLAQEAERPGRTLFVGDGINDAPVLARADAGIALGAGADAALETADIVLMTGSTGRLAESLRRARRTRSIVRQNIAFALGFKLVFLTLGALGQADMWVAVVADVGVTLLAVLNSVRAME